MKNTIAYCGIDCESCKNYKQNMNCQGCKLEEKLIDDCPTKKCCVEIKIDYCNQCNTFPCQMMDEFYKTNPQREKALTTLLNLK